MRRNRLDMTQGKNITESASFKLCLASSFLFCSVVFIALPASLYGGNADEFSWPISHIILSYWPLVLGTLLIILLSMVILPSTLRLAWAAGCAALALYVWIYGSFVIHDFGAIDGDRWVIKSPRVRATAEIVMAITGIVVAFLVARARPALVSGIITLVALGNVASVLPVMSADERTAPTTRDASSLYAFSAQKNVLVVLLDALQSDIFEEVLNENAELAKMLDGFTFFPDTAGVAPTTYLTIPALHSGLVYDRKMSPKAYYQAGVVQGSFLNELARGGYNTAIINPVTGACPRDVGLCITDTDVLGGGGNASLDKDRSTILDLVLLRLTPLPFKRDVYNEGKWRIAPLMQDPRLTHFVLRGNALLAELATKLTTTSEQPTAKFLHLFGTHLPIVLDQDCQYRAETLELTRGNYKLQVRCSLNALELVLSAMKTHGIYDRAAIVLLADHGTARMTSERVLNPQPSDLVSPALIGPANPTLAIKPPNARGAMKKSDDLLSIADVPSILCDAIGDCHVAARPREAARVYNFWRYDRKHLGKDRIPGIVGYEISGPLFNSESWRRIEERSPESLDVEPN